jgi:hypothetical protein
MTNKQIEQVTKQLAMISTQLTDMELIRSDRSTLDIKAKIFGKYEQRFTVALTACGNVKKGSVRFYDVRDAELN